MMNAATPVILGPGRSGHVLTGYFPRPKQKAKGRTGRIVAHTRTC